MKTSFDPLMQRYPSQRYPIYARGGMVNCSSPQAAAAGLEILRRVGNAMDAAVAAAAALTVVEPTANGIGADAFALVWSEKDQRLYGLNSSGPAPALASVDRVLAEGKDDAGKMPAFGWTPVTVPGAPKAWAELTRRFGRLSLAENVGPAVKYAREGYPCAPNLALMWQSAFRRYRSVLTDPAFAGWFHTFAPEDRAPEAGDMIFLPDHANTLEAIGATSAEAFYTGDLARAMDAESRKFGGYLRYEDLAAYQAQWVEPIRVSYRGYEVCEIPPNGQGIVALMALNILKNYDFRDKDPLYMTHRQLEAMKIAFADALATVTDPRYMTTDYHLFLEDSYGRSRASEISETAGSYSPQPPHKSGTVYLNAADKDGNMISFITSNYMDFGSGIVIKDTGITLQNRGHDFSLDPKAANYLLPRKRSYHTIIPGFLMKDGKPIGPFGVMGAYMQPQGHVQVLMNLLDRGLPPQAALDLPRWQWIKEKEFLVEPDFDRSLVDALRQKGHTIRFAEDPYSFGRGQVIWRLENGIYTGGTESRSDGSIVVY